MYIVPPGIDQISVEQYLLAVILDLSLCTLGIIGCLILICCYRLVISSRKYTFRLIIYFTISSAIYSLFSIIGDIQQLFAIIPEGETCTMQAFFRQIAVYCVFMFGCAISHIFYIRADRGDIRVIDLERKLVPIILVVSIIPSIV